MKRKITSTRHRLPVFMGILPNWNKDTPSCQETQSVFKWYWLLLLLPVSGSLYAQTSYTSAGTGSWGTAATWTPSGVPGATDHVTIATGDTVTLAANSSITTGDLTVTGTLDLAGFDLTAGSLGGGGNIGSASGTPTLTVGENNSGTTYSGVYSGSGAQLTKVGTDTLTLTATNTFTGITTISAGTLSIGSGGTTGAIANTSNITNNSTLVINRSDPYTYSGVISGTGAVTTASSGLKTLTGANTYTGITTVILGTLSIGSGSTSGSISNSSNVNNNATLTLHVSRTGGGRARGCPVGRVVSGCDRVRAVDRPTPLRRGHA